MFEHTKITKDNLEDMIGGREEDMAILSKDELNAYVQYCLLKTSQITLGNVPHRTTIGAHCQLIIEEILHRYPVLLNLITTREEVYDC